MATRLLNGYHVPVSCPAPFPIRYGNFRIQSSRRTGTQDSVVPQDPDGYPFLEHVIHPFFLDIHVHISSYFRTLCTDLRLPKSDIFPATGGSIGSLY
jgi:hypothetical protein